MKIPIYKKYGPLTLSTKSNFFCFYFYFVLIYFYFYFICCQGKNSPFGYLINSPKVLFRYHGSTLMIQIMRAITLKGRTCTLARSRTYLNIKETRNVEG